MERQQYQIEISDASCNCLEQQERQQLYDKREVKGEIIFLVFLISIPVVIFSVFIYLKILDIYLKAIE